MVAVFFKMKHPVQDDEYIDRDCLHAGVVEGIGHALYLKFVELAFDMVKENSRKQENARAPMLWLVRYIEQTQ